MSTYTTKDGDTLDDISFELLDRRQQAIDTSAIASVLFYSRKKGAVDNDIDGEPCTVSVDGVYLPAVAHGGGPGKYYGHFKVHWTSGGDRRIPSRGDVEGEVEQSYG